ncbi:MAG: hypothetical protein DSY42_06620 [Aquifex sp.]|nr:MAG: hypothetical protein DSY42_06620 [Aquifex sp.]
MAIAVYNRATEAAEFYVAGRRIPAFWKKIRRGEEPDNYVNPRELSKLEIDLLKDAFKVVEDFQSFIEHRFLPYLPS